ncbi:MAG: GAF domain-containing sensor histidine kinase [Microvirga sp.]
MDRPVEADIRTIARMSAVPTILRIISETTKLRFAAVARVTETSWTACAVLDRIDFGLRVGGSLDVTSTLCSEIRSSRDPIIIERASRDTVYCNHPTPRMYGFESYIAVPIIRRSGEVFGTICALDPLPAKLLDGRIPTMVQLYADLIASQLEVEEQLEESRAALAIAAETAALREQFIAVLGHDLRNPLFSIDAGVRLLSRTPRDERETLILSQMRQSSARMSELIDNILDFARGRLGGGIPVERRMVSDLGGTLGRIVSELQSSHPHRRIDVTMDIRGPVHCDPNRVAQLFSNLLANALAHGAGEGLITVAARGAHAGLQVAVTNEGPAIPPQVMQRLFKPYARIPTGEPQAGLGLGLYIAAEIARAHDGAIDVVSTEEQGTTFTFRCPPPAAQG